MHSKETFSLSDPVLVCRWRLHNGELPLLNRHMRALAARASLTTPELAAWAKEHTQDCLAKGSMAYPEGVLMLVVDKKGAAAMSVGPYNPLANTTKEALFLRAQAAQKEGALTGVLPEVLAAEQDGALTFYQADTKARSGFFSLVVDLADTLQIPYIFAPFPAEPTLEVALLSDEHGIVQSKASPLLTRLSQAAQKLFTK